MSNSTSHAVLPPEIDSVLVGLRRRIRFYVWLEGASLAIVWITAMFWLGLALDYLPVLAGIGEMPRLARAFLLAITASVLVFILYRWLIRRVFASIGDRSLALLLERRFHEFRDGLITAVELHQVRDEHSEAWRSMLADTQREALACLPNVRLANVFNYRPLLWRLSGAIVLALSLAGLYVADSAAFELGFHRLYLLNDTAWPRQARIEVVGVELGQTRGTGAAANLIPFRDASLKAAKGSNLSLVVRAEASRSVVPEVCSIYYSTSEGDRGRVNMTSVGYIRNNYQYYKYDGKPLDGILSDIRFDVVGYDHRVSDFRIQVVDSPAVTGVKVKCEFPEYMVDPQQALWTPRTVDYVPGLQLPSGTKISLHCQANKPLKEVAWSDPDAEADQGARGVAVPTGDLKFEYPPIVLNEHLTLDVMLVDTDNVVSERPYRIHISAIEDLPPVVEMRLRGIGAAVTPDVRMPFEGKITDDYGLARTWIELQMDDGAPREMPFSRGDGGKAETVIDFRVQRSMPEGLVLVPQGRLRVNVKATDKRELGSGPNTAAGDLYELNVVTPEQLLALLESRELALRRRFEQIIQETTETRDMLARVKADGPQHAATTIDPEESVKAATEGGAAGAPAQLLAEKLRSVWSLRLLRARQAIAQSEKSAQELLGVAAAFRDIREELTNNRVDSEDRKLRLTEQIADPLQKVAEELFPELDRRLESLAEVLGRIEQAGSPSEEDPATVDAAQAAIDQANRILLEMESVLQKMLDIESFHELLDIVRSLIDDQEKVLEATKSEQKRAVLDLLK